jgi:hypothetical protein
MPPSIFGRQNIASCSQIAKDCNVVTEGDLARYSFEKSSRRLVSPGDWWSPNLHRASSRHAVEGGHSSTHPHQ